LRSLITSAGQRDEIAVELAKMLAAFPAASQSDAPTKLRMQAFFEALGDAPLWAISDARQRVIGGQAGLDQRFAPTPPQFAETVRAILKPYRDDLRDMEAIAGAANEQEPTAQERGRVTEGFQKLQADLGAIRAPKDSAP
jgi:hypothetical protein